MIKFFANASIYFSLAALLWGFGVSVAFSQGESEGQMLSVTPPLFQISAAPGDRWASALKIVNGNAYELKVYAEVVIFVPEGERGQGRFYPLDPKEHGSSTFATWIQMARGPHIIPPERSHEINFTVEVPKDAPPGGHFAAVLISTEPAKSDGPVLLKTSQVVSSLFFARIDGDIVESADIREFRIAKRFVEEPVADFILRFQNKGNVYIQPRGNIVIMNMWGKERGVIPINNQSNFGNVLPETIREFEFSWKGEGGISEIGRHKAIVTLAYGEDGVKSTSATTYFWVVPLKATLITLGIIIAFILFVVWIIRLYVRRMLALAGVDVRTKTYVGTVHTVPREDDVRLTTYKNVSAPIRSGAHDLKDRLSRVHAVVDVCVTLVGFVWQYKLFFASVLILASGFVAGVMFISNATQDQRDYEITLEREGEQVTVNSEEVIRETIRPTSEMQVDEEKQSFGLVIVNESGESGAGAEMAVLLEQSGYTVNSLELGEEERDTDLLIYDPGLVEVAEKIASLLGNIDMSIKEGVPENGATSTITIYVGK